MIIIMMVMIMMIMIIMIMTMMVMIIIIMIIVILMVMVMTTRGDLPSRKVSTVAIDRASVLSLDPTIDNSHMWDEELNLNICFIVLR